jgi:hypothetical protein
MMCQQPPWGQLTAVNVNTGEFSIYQSQVLGELARTWSVDAQSYECAFFRQLA